VGYLGFRGGQNLWQLHKSKECLEMAACGHGRRFGPAHACFSTASVSRPSGRPLGLRNRSTIHHPPSMTGARAPMPVPPMLHSTRMLGPVKRWARSPIVGHRGSNDQTPHPHYTPPAFLVCAGPDRRDGPDRGSCPAWYGRQAGRGQHRFRSNHTAVI
jgi:hypothetical protein